MAGGCARAADASSSPAKAERTSALRWIVVRVMFSLGRVFAHLGWEQSTRQAKTGRNPRRRPCAHACTPGLHACTHARAPAICVLFGRYVSCSLRPRAARISRAVGDLGIG